jgi:signal transduction histidine kinase
MSIAVDPEMNCIQAAGTVVPSGIDPEFAATLAHEMRNLLAPLGNSLELLNLPGVDEHAASQARAVMGRQIRHLQRLINDLLDVHRLERQEIELVTCPLDLNELVRSVCEDHEPLFLARDIQLCLTLPEQPLWLEVDPDRLDQALNNLLQNGLKFTDRGGRVSVGVELDSPRRGAVIFVRDTGIGIEPAMMRAIFHTHAHDSSDRNRSGLGFGLPLARRLVELHGGSLEGVSAGRGQGSEFRIHLPLPACLASARIA